MTPPALLTEAEAADALRICTRTLRRLRQRGAIRFVAVTSRSVAYRLEDLQAFIEQRARICEEAVPTRRTARARRQQAPNVLSFTARREQRRGTR